MTFFSSHSYLLHICLGLARIGFHRESKCCWEWKVSLCRNSLLYACSATNRGGDSCVKKAAVTSTGTSLCFGDRAYRLRPGLCPCCCGSTEKWNKTHVIAEPVKCFICPEVKWLLYKLTPLENEVDFWNEMSLRKWKAFLNNKMNQNGTFCLVLNFHFLSNKNCFLHSMQFAALVNWKPHYSMDFISKMAWVH